MDEGEVQVKSWALLGRRLDLQCLNFNLMLETLSNPTYQIIGPLEKIGPSTFNMMISAFKP